jgi:hypothetical protein
VRDKIELTKKGEIMTYQIIYGHTHADSTPGTLTLAATNDADAIRDIRKFVADGYRNETWAAIDLADGRAYTVRNVHGKAVGRYA